MHYRTLGASGLPVPVMGLSTGNFATSAAAGLSERIATRLVDIAVDREASFFDTSSAHPDAQTLLGRILGKRRSAVVISAQAGPGNGNGPTGHWASRHNLIRACEQSLVRLGTDYLDLLQVQSFDCRTPLEETISTLDSLIQAGKVRYIGCSDFAAWQLMKALAIAEKHGWPRFVAHQFTYSLAARSCETELLPCGADQRVGTLARGGLMGGALAGNFGQNSRPAHVGEIIECLGDISNETGASKAQAALAWLLQQSTVSCAIVGASCAEQLQANLDAIDLRLTGNQIARLDDTSARLIDFPGAAPKNVQSPPNEVVHCIAAQAANLQRAFVPG